MNPNFYCVGTQKAGTTKVFDILKSHPEVFLPENKEEHFFDNDLNFEKGIDWYINNYFQNVENQKVVGGFTPCYLYFPYCAQRIYETYGESTKILIILRNPMERGYSQYLMSKRRGYEELEFLDACEQEMSRITNSFQSKERFSYISRGMYYEQVQRYLTLFGAQNVLILKYEQLFSRANFESEFNKIFDFLEIQKIDVDITSRSNMAAEPKLKFVRNIVFKENFVKKLAKKVVYNPKLRSLIRNKIEVLNTKPISEKISEDDKKFLYEQYFAQDIENLETLIDMDFTEWKIK